MQGQAVAAVPVLADLNQPAQLALQLRELPDLAGDRPELGLGGPDDVVGAALRRAEQLADLPEREPEAPGPADERQPLPVGLGVLPVPRARAFWPGQQAPALIEPDGLDADAFLGGEPPDRHPCHAWQANSRTEVQSQAPAAGLPTGPCHHGWLSRASAGGGATSDHKDLAGAPETETEPDARYTLANERTFLAWNRTALALVVAGLGIVQLLPPFPGVPWGRHVLGIPLIAFGAVVGVAAYWELRRNQTALRRGQPLPRSLLPQVLAVVITGIAVLAAVVLLVSAVR